MKGALCNFLVVLNGLHFVRWNSFTYKAMSQAVLYMTLYKYLNAVILSDFTDL